MNPVKKKTVTIYEVAERAGVSPSTVSRVLNAPSKVNEGTRERVLEAIDHFSFVPKAEAVARARQNLYRIGILLPFFTEASFIERIRGISGVVNSSEYELIMYTVKSKQQLSECLGMLRTGNRLDGLIVLGLDIPEKSRNGFMSAGLPAVFIQENYNGFSSVSIDNKHGGRLAAEYLLRKGYKRLGFVGEYSAEEYTVTATEQRLEGFRERIEEEGLQLEDLYIRTSEFAERSVEQGIRSMLELPVRPDAVFAVSDIIAAKVMKEAAACGLRVPEDLGVIGFDDLEIADYLRLTTIRQNLEASGKLAAELLQRQINFPGEPTSTVYLDLSVIERESC